MRSIYSTAERVIGWLGLDQDGGSQAVSTLDNLFKNVRLYPDNFEWVERVPELFTVNAPSNIRSGDNAQVNKSNDRIEKLWRLFTRPFWKRIWILQELVLNPNMRLLCGEEFMDLPEPIPLWNTVLLLSELSQNVRPNSVPLELWMRLNDCFLTLRLWAQLRLRHLHPGAHPSGALEGISGFLYARIRLGLYGASDPRDHVYGLFGLFDLNMVADYGENSTVADVYIKVACHGLNAGNPDNLSLAGMNSWSERTGYKPLDAPSWAPDWRMPPSTTNNAARYPQSHAFPSNGKLCEGRGSEMA